MDMQGRTSIFQKKMPQKENAHFTPMRNQITDLNAIGFQPHIKKSLGNDKYSEETNKTAFSVVQEFITL